MVEHRVESKVIGGEEVKELRVHMIVHSDIVEFAITKEEIRSST